MQPDGPKLYSSLASWWPLLSAPADYEEEAGLYQNALLAACEKRPSTMLELGSGGGNNASFLKARFQMTLVDRSPGMLEVSRALNPECEHVQGDMRTVRLDREFDTVFVHDAICYLTTEADVRQAIQTAYIHCRPGGAVLFAPDHVRENFPGSATDHGGHDGDGRALRYLEWTWDPDPSDTTYTVDYAYDLDGNVTEATYPSGRIVTYSRDALGRISSVTTKKDSSSAAVALASSVTYQPFGPLAAFTYGNGLVLTKTFTQDYRLNGLTVQDGSTVILDRAHAFGDGLNLTGITDNLISARSESYLYTATNRLQERRRHLGQADLDL